MKKALDILSDSSTFIAVTVFLILGWVGAISFERTIMVLLYSIAVSAYLIALINRKK